ncbi:GNAT family N-acetyltransferase [Pedobacter sp. PWIIR3]
MTPSLNIRIAQKEDCPAIGLLLDQLGYPTEPAFLTQKIMQLVDDPNHSLIVYDDGGVKGVISIHFVPQIAFANDYAIISYLTVDEWVRSKGIGRQLEEHCVTLAKARNCNKIELHSNIRRADAHRFYERQGYEESRKCFRKKLN